MDFIGIYMDFNMGCTKNLWTYMAFNMDPNKNLWNYFVFKCITESQDVIIFLCRKLKYEWAFVL